MKNSPYGEKSKAQLVKYAKDIFNFFETKGAKIVVMACNTTSAMVYEELKNDYSFKIYPIIQSVSKVIAELPIKRLGVFATLATVNSAMYTNSIKISNPEMKIKEIPAPAWVKIVENQKQNDEISRVLIKENIDEMMEFAPEKIVLGCTHYPYLLDILGEFVSKDIFIDPARIFVEFIKSDLKDYNLLNNSELEGQEEFFVSANPTQFKSAAKMFYKLKNEPTLIEFRDV